MIVMIVIVIIVIMIVWYVHKNSLQDIDTCLLTQRDRVILRSMKAAIRLYSGILHLDVEELDGHVLERDEPRLLSLQRRMLLHDIRHLPANKIGSPFCADGPTLVTGHAYVARAVEWVSAGRGTDRAR